MEKITNTDELPEWFYKSSYGKQLSNIDWYREILRRQRLSSVIELCRSQQNQESATIQQNLFNLLVVDDIRPDSIVFNIQQNGLPVSDLTVGETAFLAFSLQQSNASEITGRYEKLLEIWREALDEMKTVGQENPTPKFGRYEQQLGRFLEQLTDEEDEVLDTPIKGYFDHYGNPFLSFGRPLNGYPLTIDLQYDDKTILQHVANWLGEKRKSDSSKARRPFNTNDFSNWEYYKIREIYDLETWATINNTKILDRVIADALWPTAPDSFSPIEVLRTTARKKVREVFTFETVVRLYGQLRLEHGENFFAK